MPDFEPLNPTLYRALERFAADQGGELVVAHEGEQMLSHLKREPFARRTGEKRKDNLKRYIDHPGEEYQLNCPFCNDTRKRLSVNYMWGVPDAETGTRNLWLMKCYNEDCQNTFRNVEYLFEQLYSHRNSRGRVRVRPGVVYDVTKLHDVNPPGMIWYLDELARRQPNHPAVQYILDRGYDPTYLAERYKVGYCVKADHPKLRLADNRIYCPIVMHGRLVGWQTRFMGEWSKGMPPKYFSCPGMARRLLAVNFDLAIQHQTVILVEGPFDVYGTGPQAMGLIGKTMSPYMRKLLIEKLRPDATVVIMLDPNQDPKEQKKGKPHHIEKLCLQLQPALPGRLLKVYLPDDTDPGNLDRSIQRDIIRDAAKEAGVRVSFGAPANPV